MTCPIRKYPFRTPKNHRVPIPRWMLSLPNVSCVYTVYVGVQKHGDNVEAIEAKDIATRLIQEWLTKSERPPTYEKFDLIEGNDAADSTIWVCYWTDLMQPEKELRKLDVTSIYRELPSLGRSSIGIWQESFATEVPRLETNYSGLDYLPGLARLPGAGTTEHTLSAYWGAARDRIPDSAQDLFPHTQHIAHPETVPESMGQYLIGANHANLVHIRSGQFWENCGQQEADAYEQKLEPTLRAGLEYLRMNTKETGAIGIRYLRNGNMANEDNGGNRKETCGAGFFNNLEDLERWAHTHQSHLKIYRGALSHYKAFGDYRRFRTWHEVCVIRKGDATFEYINCTSGTGAIGLLPLENRPTM